MNQEETMVSVNFNHEELTALIHFLQDMFERASKRDAKTVWAMFDKTSRTTKDEWIILSEMFQKEPSLTARVSIHMTYTQMNILHNCLTGKIEDIEEWGFCHVIVNNYMFNQLVQLYSQKNHYRQIMRRMAKK